MLDLISFALDEIAAPPTSSSATTSCVVVPVRMENGAGSPVNVIATF
jgi:hypothetical protein